MCDLLFMTTAAQALTGLVALIHFYIWILEMFLWQTPLGMKAFRMNAQKAKDTAVLAANQGLYNMFLALGLCVSLALANPEQAFLFRAYFLACVVAAGVYGALSVSKRIFWIQAFPAALALGLTIAVR